MRQRVHSKAYVMVVKELSIWRLPSLFEVLWWCPKWYKWQKQEMKTTKGSMTNFCGSTTSNRNVQLWYCNTNKRVENKLNLIQQLTRHTITNTIFKVILCKIDLIIYYKCMHLIIHFNSNVTQLFLHTFLFFLMFNIFTKMHVANNV